MDKILNFFRSELSHFNDFSPNVKKLLLANFLYSFAVTFMNIFVVAYIFSKSDNATVVIYNFGLYLGLPVIFALNGFLFRIIGIKALYSLGMVASGATIFYMMTLSDPTTFIFFISGFFVGVCYGLHWANRNYLILDTTNNNNRNYYTGIEFFLFTMVNLMAPVLSGLFISFGDTSGLYSKDTAYLILIGIIFLICAFAAWVIMRGTYKTPKLPKYLFFKFKIVWKRMQLFALLKGSYQGAVMILPSLLVLNLIGDEKELGIIYSMSAVLSGIAVFVAGRIAKPGNRIHILIVSLGFFIFGSIMHSLLFSLLSVLIWQACQIMADPMSYAAYNPIMMRAMDVSAKDEDRPAYTYIVNHEIYTNLGRVIGCLIFLVFINYISDVFALRHFLLVIGLIQVASIFVAKKLPV